MLESAHQSIPEHALTLPGVLSDLLNDGHITAQQRELLLFQIQQNPDETSHPVTVVAEQGWPKAHNPKVMLDAEELTRWLRRSQQPAVTANRYTEN